jgi:hypothetical protein
MSISTLNLWANRWAQRSRELWFEVSADRLKAGIFITGRLVVLLPSALVERNCPLHLLLAGNPPADSWACPTVSTNVHARHSSNSLFSNSFILYSVSFSQIPMEADVGQLSPISSQIYFYFFN